MNNKRIHRISEEIKRELSDIIQNKLKDPRIPPLTSVSFVSVTGDLSYATVGISVFGDDQAKEDALEGLKSAKGFMKKELGRNMKLRAMPELLLELDDSIEKGIELQQQIDALKDSE
ncbi:Ribosome-binding factor A [Aedoeadaptatus ivorii]|uniref:Ribosome-binding factor A n=1 Tax=Aedoeadaptatus ivorii TaxID=54006 RepID=A0A448V1E6_9FIRM|nr:30S ribosome-binding factor RbfA [Peptoniphilus ivorii]MDQ0507814.1 ribosome-binding factor A [Peptoniphilus ivorii]VEJ35641.1 Ribosome-binding factor A [Peptoniphilus ivorii]